jgi:hypothetical protein
MKAIWRGQVIAESNRTHTYRACMAEHGQQE